jgi:hypothetical protein
LLRVKCGSPGRRQIATRRGQQLDATIRARLLIPLSFAMAAVSAFWPKADTNGSYLLSAGGSDGGLTVDDVAGAAAGLVHAL